MEIFSFLSYEFIQRAYLAGIFIAVLCAVLGLFLVLRRMSLIGDGLSHVSFGAIALGLFLGIYPFYIAIPLVIISSFIIFKLSEKTKTYGDAAIGIVSAVGIAGGIILASLSRGFNIDLFSYLFGSILAITSFEVIASIVLSAVVLLIIIFFYHDFFAVTFDSQHAKISGINVDLINFILTFLTAITVILAVKVVGVMLVSALLIIPAVSALQIAKGFRRAMIIAAWVAVLSVIIGITISYFQDLPAGATIVIISFLFFLGSLLHKKIVK